MMDASPEGAGSPLRQGRKAFTTGQMSEMIRHRAFSSGFQNYRDFACKTDSGRLEARRAREQHLRASTGTSLAQLNMQRNNFYERRPSAFGVEFVTSRDAEVWEDGIQGLGRKSASEGALLRYALCASQEMTRSVRDDLGVDVTKTTRRQIRKPSFATRLDI